MTTTTRIGTWKAALVCAALASLATAVGAQGPALAPQVDHGSTLLRGDVAPGAPYIVYLGDELANPLLVVAVGHLPDRGEHRLLLTREMQQRIRAAAAAGIGTYLAIQTAGPGHGLVVLQQPKRGPGVPGAPRVDGGRTDVLPGGDDGVIIVCPKARESTATGSGHASIGALARSGVPDPQHVQVLPVGASGASHVMD